MGTLLDTGSLVFLNFSVHHHQGRGRLGTDIVAGCSLPQVVHGDSEGIYTLFNLIGIINLEVDFELVLVLVLFFYADFVVFTDEPRFEVGLIDAEEPANKAGCGKSGRLLASNL